MSPFIVDVPQPFFPLSTTESKTKPGSESPLMTKQKYSPVDGSWVAELEAAEKALEKVERSMEDKASAEEQKERRGGELILANLRLCRALSMLRQWEALKEASTRGVRVCPTHRSLSASSRISKEQARFESYRDRAHRELSVPSDVDRAWYREFLRDVLAGKKHPNSWNLPARLGDMRLLEAMVANGAALEMPVVSSSGIDRRSEKLYHWAPSDATDLVIVCADLAAHNRERAKCDAARLQELDRSTECAMQLVRLGADPTRTLNLDLAPNTEMSRGYRAMGFDGKTALELARMSHREELVALMELHLCYTPEERAQVVHCRCGSRLPWTACHSTGIGHASHYTVDEELGIMYRVSPLARCPCFNTALTHYECCWKDTSTPTYLADATGERIRVVPTALGGMDPFDAYLGIITVDPGKTAKDMAAEYASLLRSDPDILRKAFDTGGGQESRVASWDPEVYAGCLERLVEQKQDNFFLWTDLHWKIDKSELLRRAEAWNKALKQYCRDKGLVGEERVQVLAKHKADPCAPCGYSGCNAFEKEPKEFRRCSICKMIAYCGPACQKKDWAHHRTGCDTLR